MPKDLIKRIHRCYGIALGIVLIITGICFMAACVGICRSGDQPFSRESVAAAFASIAAPVYLCLAMIAVSFLLNLFLPDDRNTESNTPKHSTQVQSAPKQERRDNTKLVHIVRGILLCVAMVLLIFGFCTGGSADVLTKAINICTECVGLG